MTDLDFDELDRAVNELSSKSASAGDDIKKGSEEEKKPTTSPTPSIQRPKTGQFMDVVHPSSDMKRGALKMPERPPIKPIKPVDSDLDISADPAAEVENKDDTEETKSDSVSEDMSGDLQLPESPFVSGAKVEKRPLGAFSSTVEDTSKSETSAETDTTTEEAQAESAVIDEQIPDDVQNDIQKIESDGQDLDTKESDNPSANQDVEDGESPEKTQDSVSSTGFEGPASIVQQYKEKPTTGDPTTGPIYDTDSYHKALVKPAKKKAGWLWVVWIILLLVVGAGAGAGFYFWILPLF